MTRADQEYSVFRCYVEYKGIVCSINVKIGQRMRTMPAFYHFRDKLRDQRCNFLFLIPER